MNVSIGGAERKDGCVDEPARTEFRDYVSGASPSLLRTAYLMTGNRADAEDLVQTSLAMTFLAWGRIREREAVDGYVRRVMVNTRTSWWRTSRHLPTSSTGDDAVLDRASVDDDYSDADL